MGRRSINTTKSGKYMNPTDQARKEARKKELKKNKKQRQMVRQAVLKNKDPGQLLEEMEKIDEMEYNVMQPSPLNEKVLKEKRKKLKETFDRVMRLLHEDDPETFSEMKRKEVDYDKRKYKRVQYFESVRHAEQVSIEDIPLPSSTNEKQATTIPKINLPPPVLLTNLSSIIPLKKPDEITETQENKEKEPPGIPPQFPPNIFEMRELDSDYESSEESEKEEITSKDEPSKDKHDKNIEEFMKEVESVQKKKEEEKTLEMRIDPTPDVDMGNEESIENEQPERPQIPPEKVEIPKIPTEQPIVLPPQPMPPMALPRMPHPLMFRPPPGLRGHLGMGIRMPPGPPPGPRPGMPRMAPGPPPRHKHHDRNQMMPPKQSTTTITAKPQIRNLSADVTRFVPSTLRSKRDEPRKTKPKSYISETQMQQVTMHKQQQQMQTKDDAYHQFMNELQDLL